jgi:hypothetical protein
MQNQNNSAGITDDDIKKAKDYKDALDALKTSISGVNSKLPEFAEGLQAGLKAIGEKLPEVVDAMVKLNAQNKELAASGQKPKSVFAELASSMFSWNSIISVGITLLTTYSGVIISWVADMLKGQTTLSALGKAMKDNKIIMDALIQSRSNGDKNAQQELVQLKLLYSATQNHTLSLKERQKAANEIRDQYPGYFKNISNDIILTGNATKQYNDLSAAIIASSRARAAEEIMVKNQIRQFGNNDTIKKLTPQLESLEKQLNSIQKQHDKLENMPVNGGSTFGMGTDSKDAAGPATISRLTQERDVIRKLITDHVADSKLLNGQNEVLVKSINDYIQKSGVQVITGLKKGSDQQNQIITTQKINQTKSLTDNEEAYTDYLTKQLLQTTNAFNKKLEQDHNNYTTEQAALKNLLDNKLITQEQYHQESQQLEEKYHVSIGEIIKRMDAEQLAKVQQQQKDLVEAQQQKELLAKDQQNVNRVILPGSKLEAEKQLITDKYNFEIQKAAEAGKDTAEIRKQYEQEITDTIQKSEQQRKDFALQTAQQISDKAFSIIGNNIKSQSDAKIKGLEKDKAAELSNKNLTSTQRQAIEAKYQKQENAEKIKAFKAEQKASILQAVINGALAITKVTSQAGMLAPFVIPGIIASTAIQVATIVAQKPPQYAKGGLHYQSDGRGALLPGYSRTDNTNAFLRSGEAVVVSEAMRNPWARNLVSAINVAHGGRDFSAPDTGSGYAIGGIFTDGGNANRYYNQPVNDVKDLANTLAYQMINNFPPIYVDVKDVNNQQNILAQTVNRVNL